MLLSAVCITLAYVFRENRVLFYIAMGLYFFVWYLRAQC